MKQQWVKATTPDGRPAWVNIAAVPTMMRANDDLSTIIFLGGVTAMVERSPDGGNKQGIRYATTMVQESPEQLIAMARSGQPLPAAPMPPKSAAKPTANRVGRRRRAR